MGRCNLPKGRSFASSLNAAIPATAAKCVRCTIHAGADSERLSYPIDPRAPALLMVAKLSAMPAAGAVRITNAGVERAALSARQRGRLFALSRTAGSLERSGTGAMPTTAGGRGGAIRSVRLPLGRQSALSRAAKKGCPAAGYAGPITVGFIGMATRSMVVNFDLQSVMGIRRAPSKGVRLRQRLAAGVRSTTTAGSLTETHSAYLSSGSQ